MDKSLKIYIVILILLLIAIIVADSNKPIPVDWSPTYGIKDKIPYGLYVLDAELPKILKNNNIKKLNVSFYEYLESNKFAGNRDFKFKGTLLSISNNHNIDNESAADILKFVGQKNNAFLSMDNFPQMILDSLKIDIRNQGQEKDSTFNFLANSKLDTAKYNFSKVSGTTYFSKIDTLNTTVLGYQKGDSTRINFIKQKYKSGYFFLHSQPAAFTNYSLLKKNNNQYAASVLSYLPNQPIYWNLKDQNGSEVSQFPLRYIFSQPALKAAWFIFLGGMLVFMIFNAKRRQRIVPILKPESNSTVDFVKTIGSLYFQEGDHDNLIQKKIIYFLDAVRKKFMLDTSVLDDNFVKKLHQKSGKSIADIQIVIFKIKSFQINDHKSSENDLIELNSAVEKLNF